MALAEEKIQAIQADYEAEELSIVAIAKKHSVSRSSIVRLEKKHKWTGRKKEPKKEAVEPEKPGRGQPTKYDKKYCKIATALAMAGFSDERIAGCLEVERNTVRRWKKKHPEFCSALKDGRFKATAKVAVSLFQSATGYSHKEDRIFNNDGEPLIVPTVKYYQPNYKSMALWLKTKEPETWKEVQEFAGEIRLGQIQPEDVEKVQNLFNDIVEE